MSPYFFRLALSGVLVAVEGVLLIIYGSIDAEFYFGRAFVEAGGLIALVGLVLGGRAWERQRNRTSY